METMIPTYADGPTLARVECPYCWADDLSYHGDGDRDDWES